MGTDERARLSPTVLRRALAWAVRRERVEKHLSQTDVARALGCRVPKVSLMENGQRLVQESDLPILFELFGVPDSEQAGWRKAVECARKRGWWEAYGEHTLPGWLQHFIGLEQGAESIQSYQPGIVHGLLQTEEYAAAIIRQSKPMSVAMAEQLVTQKMRRQRAIDHADDPLKVTAVMDESALQRVVGDHEIMARQLSHLTDIATDNDNVVVQVIPLDRDGAFAASYGAFTILSLGFRTAPVVYIEQRTAAVFLEGVDETEAYSVLFEQVRDLALSPDESIERIEANREAHEKRATSGSRP